MTVEDEHWQPHVTVAVLLVQAEAVVGVGHLAQPHHEVIPQAGHHRLKVPPKVLQDGVLTSSRVIVSK